MFNIRLYMYVCDTVCKRPPFSSIGMLDKVYFELLTRWVTECHHSCSKNVLTLSKQMHGVFKGAHKQTDNVSSAHCNDLDFKIGHLLFLQSSNTECLGEDSHSSGTPFENFLDLRSWRYTVNEWVNVQLRYSAPHTCVSVQTILSRIPEWY